MEHLHVFEGEAFRDGLGQFADALEELPDWQESLFRLCSNVFVDLHFDGSLNESQILSGQIHFELPAISFSPVDEVCQVNQYRFSSIREA